MSELSERRADWRRRIEAQVGESDNPLTVAGFWLGLHMRSGEPALLHFEGVVEVLTHALHHGHTAEELLDASASALAKTPELTDPHTRLAPYLAAVLRDRETPLPRPDPASAEPVFRTVSRHGWLTPEEWLEADFEYVEVGLHWDYEGETTYGAIHFAIDNGVVIEDRPALITGCGVQHPIDTWLTLDQIPVDEQHWCGHCQKSLRRAQESEAS